MFNFGKFFSNNHSAPTGMGAFGSKSSHMGGGFPAEHGFVFPSWIKRPMIGKPQGVKVRKGQ